MAVARRNLRSRSYQLPATQPIETVPNRITSGLPSAVADSMYRSLNFPPPDSRHLNWESNLANHPVPAAATKPLLFERYAPAADAALKFPGEINRFFKAIVTTNLDVTNASRHDRQIDRLADRFVQDGGFSASPYRLPQIGAEDAIKPIRDIEATMARLLAEATAISVNQLVRGIHALHEAQQIGDIHWFDNSVCRFRFYRFVADEHVTSERRQIIGHHVRDTGRATTEYTFTSVEQDWHRSLVQERHEHDLIEANGIALERDHAQKPDLIQNLITEIPPWLVPHVRCVRGILIAANCYRRTLLEETWTETMTETQVRNTYRADPCLTFGKNAVLTGWKDDEPAPPSRLRYTAWLRRG